MTTARKIEIAVFLAVLFGAFFALYQWHQSHEAVAVAQAQAEAIKQNVAQQEVIRKQAADDSAKLQAQMQQMQASFAQQLASIRTPAQAQPIILQEAAKALPQGSYQATVDPHTGAATYTLTPEGVVALGKEVATCDESKKELDVCQHQVVDLTSQIHATEAQRDSYKTESVNWQKVAKGGSTWQRVGKAMKYVGIGALIGGAIVAAAKH